jgi:hypothetical protein
MSSRDQAGGGSAATSSNPRPILPVSHHVEAIRVFGRVDVRKVQTNNLRSDIREAMTETFEPDIARIRQIQQRHIDRWNKPIIEGRKLEWFQLPSVLCVLPAEMAVVDAFQTRWITQYTRYMRQWTTDEEKADQTRAMYDDAYIDLYTLVMDHYKLLYLFAAKFALEENRAPRTSILEPPKGPNRSCFNIFLRLPPTEHASVMKCMAEVTSNGLFSHLPCNTAGSWSKFTAAMEHDLLVYERLSYECTREPHPDAADHTLQFESKDEYRLRTALLDGDSSKGIRNHLDEHHWATGASYRAGHWIAHVAHPLAAHHLQHTIAHDLRGNKHLQSVRLHQEVMAAVVKSSPTTIFIGSASFTRLYHVLRFVDIECLTIYFEVQPIFSQFNSLIRWAMWQLFDWKNIWYRGHVFDEEQMEQLENTVEGGDVPMPDTIEEEVIRLVDASERQKRMKEFINRQFAFQPSMTFEDVVASVSWEHTIQATRQDVFEAFPPAVAREQFGKYSTVESQAAFNSVWTQNMSPAHALDMQMNLYRANPASLVSHVIRALTFMQVVEDTDNEVPYDIFVFLMYLTWWQFSGPPKVDVLKYVIQRMRPNAAIVAQFIAAKYPYGRIGISGKFVDLFLFPNSHTIPALPWLFLAYAKSLKGRDELAARLMTSNVLPALVNGVNKTMPTATLKVAPVLAPALVVVDGVTKAMSQLAINKSNEQKIENKALNPSDYNYSTVDKHTKVAADVLYTKVLGEFLGLKLSHGGSTGTRLVSPVEYLASKPQHRVKNGIDPRLQEAFIFQPYQPLFREVRSSAKQSSAPTATIRHAPDAVMGESASAPPPSKRSK